MLTQALPHILPMESVARLLAQQGHRATLDEREPLYLLVTHGRTAATFRTWAGDGMVTLHGLRRFLEAESAESTARR